MSDPANSANSANSVTVVDFRIPFWRLVAVLLKIALAAVPASILFVIILWAVVALLRLIGFGLMMGAMQI